MTILQHNPGGLTSDKDKAFPWQLWEDCGLLALADVVPCVDPSYPSALDIDTPLKKRRPVGRTLAR